MFMFHSFKPIMYLITALCAHCSLYWLHHLLITFLLVVSQEKNSQFTIIRLSQLKPVLQYRQVKLNELK